MGATGGWLRQHRADVIPAGLVLAVGGGLLASLSWLVDVVGQAGEPAAAADVAVVLSGSQTAAQAALIVAQAAVLLVRRRRPVATLVAVTVLDAVMSGLSSGDLGLGRIAVAVAVYTVAAHVPRRPALLAMAGCAALSGVVAVLQLGGEGGPGLAVTVVLVQTAVGFALPALIGEYLATRRRYERQLTERIALVEHDRETRAAWAVQAERARMARELHDVAAHHLSGIVVMAGAADKLLDSDTVRTRDYLRQIRTQGSETLANLRLAVGVLRDANDTGAGEQEPTPTLAEVPALVARLRERGADVDLPGDDARVLESVGLGPLADLTAYRMVQESLSNAASHAPGAPCTVRARESADQLEVVVTNAPAAAPPSAGRRAGFGLLGMRERAALVGGSLDAGPTLDGGWRVRLVVPVPADVSLSAPDERAAP